MGLTAIDIGDGPPAVLLHGQPGSARDWSPVTERLREGIRVIAPDRPGYGSTGGSAVGFRENATAVIALLDRLEVESAVVAAHSWATGVALAMAADFPERVRALVLAAPVAPGPSPSAADRLFASRLIGPAAARFGFRAAGLALSLPPLQRLARRAVPALSPEQVSATAELWRTGRVWRSFFAEQRALVAELPSLEPQLASVAQPATILYGTWDLMARPAQARRLADELPHTELIPVRRAGHMLPQQRPGLVARAIASAAAGEGLSVPKTTS